MGAPAQILQNVRNFHSIHVQTDTCQQPESSATANILSRFPLHPQNYIGLKEQRTMKQTRKLVVFTERPVNFYGNTTRHQRPRKILKFFDKLF